MLYRHKRHLKIRLSCKYKTRLGTHYFTRPELSLKRFMFKCICTVLHILWFTGQDYTARMQNLWQHFVLLLSHFCQIWENRRERRLTAGSFLPWHLALSDKWWGEGRGNNVLKLGVSYLNSLPSLLSICQELNSESPGILEGVLEVDKAVAHVSSHGTFPTYGDRTGITVKMQYLEEQ